MLAALRRMQSEQVLRRLAIHVKPDLTYVPRKNLGSRRWHVFTQRGNFEIVTTASLWYDTREKLGGGAIDLAMHLLGVSFVEAVRHLSNQEQLTAFTTRCTHRAVRPDSAPAASTACPTNENMPARAGSLYAPAETRR